MTLSLKYLIDNGGILFGSKALNVATETSDYDIAICKDNIEIPNYVSVIDITHYMNASFPLRNCALIKKYDTGTELIDILLFENQSDVDSIKEAVNELKKIPIQELSDKDTRIRLFEKLLDVEDIQTLYFRKYYAYRH